MVQVYFLLIICNLLMGLILSKDFFSSKIDNFNNMDQLLSNEMFQVTIGCLGTIIGFLALFLRYTGNILILGDLFPAITAITSGITLFINYIDNEENSNSSIIVFVKNVFLKNRIVLGFLAIFAGVIHFIAPSINLI